MSGRKQITIPLGYDPDDNDIGNHSQVSGLNYEFWYALHDDVKSVLGESSNDIGFLCRSSSINKWAAFKPSRYTPETQLWHYTGMGVSGDDIVYESPREAQPDPRDLSQFLGYNHNATEPKVIVADNYSYTYDGEEKEKQFPETMIVTLPEFDIRNGVRNAQITHWTTKVTCKLNSGDKVTETHEEIIDDEVSVKSLGASFKIYEANDASYEIDIEVWFGTTSDYYMFKHPDSPKSSTATKQVEYQLSVISADMDYAAEYSNATVNNTTGAYAYVDLVIKDGSNNQRGGTARENVYIGGVLTDIGQANFSASDPITNSGTLPEALTPLENDVVIILTNFNVDPL